MSIKLVVWDWNGTLFDDMQAVLDAANAAEVPIFGLPPLTMAQLQDIHEVPLMKAYEKLGVSNDTFREKSDQINEAFHKAYEPLVAKATLRDGGLGTLTTLCERGVRNIILSNHSTEGIYPHLIRLGIDGYFDDVLANDSLIDPHFNGKQHRLESYIAANSLLPDDLLIIGDTPEEAFIAQNIGAHSVLLTGGMCSEERLRAANPEKLISSLDQFVSAVEELA